MVGVLNVEWGKEWCPPSEPDTLHSSQSRPVPPGSHLIVAVAPSLMMLLSQVVQVSFCSAYLPTLPILFARSLKLQNSLSPDCTQPSILSIFSSTSSHPLALATTTTCNSLTSDSFISLVQDSDNSELKLIAHSGNPTEQRTLRSSSSEQDRGNLNCAVLHLQSPNVKATGVRFAKLGITLPFVHFAIKNEGQACYFELKVRDQKGDRIVIRASTFQVSC